MDFLKHIVPAGFAIGMMKVYNITAFTDSDETYGSSSLLFILYGWSIIPFSYLFGFVFKQYGSA